MADERMVVNLFYDRATILLPRSRSIGIIMSNDAFASGEIMKQSFSELDGL